MIISSYNAQYVTVMCSWRSFNVRVALWVLTNDKNITQRMWRGRHPICSCQGEKGSVGRSGRWKRKKKKKRKKNEGDIPFLSLSCANFASTDLSITSTASLASCLFCLINSLCSSRKSFTLSFKARFLRGKR